MAPDWMESPRLRLGLVLTFAPKEHRFWRLGPSYWKISDRHHPPKRLVFGRRNVPPYWKVSFCLPKTSSFRWMISHQTRGRMVDPNQKESTNRPKGGKRTNHRKRRRLRRPSKIQHFLLPVRSEGSGELLVVGLVSSGGLLVEGLVSSGGLLVESLVSDVEHLANTLEDALSELGFRIL